jgi:hypothetical protein
LETRASDRALWTLATASEIDQRHDGGGRGPSQDGEQGFSALGLPRVDGELDSEAHRVAAARRPLCRRRERMLDEGTAAVICATGLCDVS